MHLSRKFRQRLQTTTCLSHPLLNRLTRLLSLVIVVPILIGTVDQPQPLPSLPALELIVLPPGESQSLRNAESGSSL
jgi:hypothetical protein